MKKIFLILLSAMLFIACDDTGTFKRNAVGNPYEVLVVCTQEFWDSPAGRALEGALDTDIPGFLLASTNFAHERFPGC